MLITALNLLAGAVLLYFGAEWLVKGSSNLALRFGVPSLVVGLTVVAFGTSAPEMVVSIKSGLEGLGGLAIGNVVGSNIFNIAVILGLSALVRPLRVNVQVLKVDTPIMVLAMIVMFVLMRDGIVGRWEAFLLFVAVVVYSSLTICLGKKSQRQMPRAEENSLRVELKHSVWMDIVLIGMGFGGLVLGSNLFVNGAVALAVAFKVSPAVIGLTIVAMGTSLPELATSIVASARKQEDIAVGNIIGSNIFNILAILGVSGMLTPLQAQGVGTVDLLFMLGTGILLLPMMGARFRLGRLEGAFFLIIYCGYLWYLWPG